CERVNTGALVVRANHWRRWVRFLCPPVGLAAPAAPSRIPPLVLARGRRGRNRSRRRRGLASRALPAVGAPQRLAALRLVYLRWLPRRLVRPPPRSSGPARAAGRDDLPAHRGAA